MNFNIFFKIPFILRDSSNANLYPKKMIFIIESFIDMDNLFTFYECFKKNLRENWSSFLEKVKFY